MVDSYNNTRQEFVYTIVTNNGIIGNARLVNMNWIYVIAALESLT